jgi:hypothetical protein
LTCDRSLECRRKWARQIADEIPGSEPVPKRSNQGCGWL